MIKRSSGVLMHISSLPSKYGVGTFGEEAFKFVDFLKRSGQKFWQVLPLCPVDSTGSSYQSYSTFAGNFCFIDLDILKEKGFLKEEDYKNLDWGFDKESLDFEKVIKNRLVVLKLAYNNYKKKGEEEITSFLEDNDWALNYAVFMALLKKYNYNAFWNWPDKFKNRDRESLEKFRKENKDEVNFYIFLQIEFFNQWKKLKDYANSNDIMIIGDLPIYVSGNSADVWKNKEYFCLNKDCSPKKVSGCPPDDFAKTGQLWGNPVYNWDEMEKDEFSWWQKRLKQYTNMFNYVRIDHFRGFDAYYEIDAKEKTAVNGEWRKGPGLLFFKTMEKKLGRLNLIAEDLGFLTDSVRKLLKDTGFFGMQILQFSFDGKPKKEQELPAFYEENRVLYIGTHDNNTAIGWFNSLDKAVKKSIIEYFGFKDEKDINLKLVEEAAKTSCKLCVFQMQDILGLDEKARMNVPSTIGRNWRWRMKNNLNLKPLEEKLYKITKLSLRI